MNPPSQNSPETTTSPPKGNGEVARFFKPSFSGGAGDVSLSPSHVHRHTPDASLGAVCGPAGAPLPIMGSQPPPDPLATPGLLRFLLGPTASKALADAGEFFTVQAYQSPRPEDAGRFVLLALPVSKGTADASARVALGKARAVKLRTATAPTSHNPSSTQ
jgi:hypothetical protein